MLSIRVRLNGLEFTLFSWEEFDKVTAMNAMRYVIEILDIRTGGHYVNA